MRKKAQCVFPVILCILLLFSGCGAFNFAQKSNEEGQALSGQGAQDCDSQEKTEGEGAAAHMPSPQDTEGILRENAVLDLGNHMVAYYMPTEEIDTAYTRHGHEAFLGKQYIAVQDLDNDAVWYLPDVYGKILEIYVETPIGVSLRYIPDEERDVRQVSIPIYFYERDGEKALDFDLFVHEKKSLLGAQDGVEAGTGALPQRVWEQSFCMGTEEYTVQFERISPIYNPGYESGEVQADYCLSVHGREGNTLFRQMIVHYPVAYEEAYWLIDFSGDGFLDVAFCTDVYMGGKNGNWSFVKMLIWNSDRGCYEECVTGAADNLAMWNTDMSVLVSCDDTMHDHHYSAKNMYVWADGQWQRIRRLERIYSETEFYDIPGNGQYPYSDGYRELIYSNGELVEENRIEKDFYEEDIFWFEEESIWSTNYRGGIRLYPEWPEWEKAETTVGGIAMNKYVRQNENWR